MLVTHRLLYNYCPRHCPGCCSFYADVTHLLYARCHTCRISSIATSASLGTSLDPIGTSSTFPYKQCVSSSSMTLFEPRKTGAGHRVGLRDSRNIQSPSNVAWGECGFIVGFPSDINVLALDGRHIREQLNCLLRSGQRFLYRISSLPFHTSMRRIFFVLLRSYLRHRIARRHCRTSKQLTARLLRRGPSRHGGPMGR